MSTIAVVDEITQYLITFGPLLGDIKIGFINLSLDRRSIINKYRVDLERNHTALSDIVNLIDSRYKLREIKTSFFNFS